MKWLKDLFAQFKSKTVWGLLTFLIVHFTGMDSDTVTGVAEGLVTLIEALAGVLTLVGINHKLEKWLEVLKSKVPG